MRLSSSSLAWIAVPVTTALALLLQCSSSSSTQVFTVNPGLDDGSLPTIDASITDPGLQPPPQDTVCPDDAGACLSGTAEAGVFAIPPAEIQASLYGLFPFATGDAGPAPLGVQKVAKDGTWAFGGVPVGQHYFVRFDPGYALDAGANLEAGAVTWIGPLAIPDDADASIGVTVKPAELQVFEQGAPGGAMQLDALLARVAEATPGGSSVSVLIGSTPTAVPYDPTRGYYYLPFTTPPAAQTSYRFTTSPEAGTPTTWTLVSNPPATAGAVTAPAGAASVTVNRALTVSWTAAADADYVLIEVFQQVAAGYAQTFAVSPPDLTTTTETLPASAVPVAGTYLLDVGFVRANCPVTSDGCVRSSRVAAQQFTAQ